MKRIAVVIGLALAMVVSASTADAQRRPATSGTVTDTDRAKGLRLTAQALIAPGITIEGDDIDGEVGTNLGGGLGLQVGYGFTRMFSAFVGFDLARLGSDVEGLEGTFGLAQFALGGRASFPLVTSPLMPYATVAVGQRALGAEVEDEDGDETDLTFSGFTFDVGGGVQYFLSPKLAIDGGLNVGFGKFGKLEIDDDDNDIDVDNTTAIRLRVGVSFFPMGSTRR